MDKAGKVTQLIQALRGREEGIMVTKSGASGNHGLRHVRVVMTGSRFMRPGSPAQDAAIDRAMAAAAKKPNKPR